MNIIVRNIPNCITCMNVLAGTIAIIFAFQGDNVIWGMKAMYWAYVFIGIAAVADFLDGFAARLLHAYSNLGKELDSLCDLVSFGVAPAMILFNCLDRPLIPAWAPCLALLIPIAGALRLAKFNIDTRQTTSFIGLPIPANAIFWIGYTAAAWRSFEAIGGIYIFVPLLLIECWLMISPVRLFSLKMKNLSWKDNKWRYLLVITAAVLIFCLGLEGLSWLIIVYVLAGVCRLGVTD